MKKCNICGFDNKDESYFCEKCGTDLKDPVNVTEIDKAPLPNKVIYANTSVRQITPEEDKKANILCTISLICYFGGAVIMALLSVIFGNADSDSIRSLVSSLGSFGGGIFHLAGLVLMIIARVKYPQNKFGKIIMWLYIALYISGFILMILGIILMIVIIGLFIESCKGING